MNKLSHYKDNLFASHSTMESALEYVTMMANTFTTENSLAVITAARVVLNTAIELHKAELDAANAPLRKLIEEEIKMSLSRVDGLIEAEIQKSYTTVNNLIEHSLDIYGRTVDAKIASAMDDIHYATEVNMRTVDEKIQTAIDDIDVEEQVRDYMEGNPMDIQDLLSGACVSITFD